MACSSGVMRLGYVHTAWLHLKAVDQVLADCVTAFTPWTLFHDPDTWWQSCWSVPNERTLHCNSKQHL